MDDGNTVVIGVRHRAGALSYLKDDGKPAGFQVEVCERIVRDYAKTPGNANVRIRYRNVTSASRLSDVLSGSVDLECGSTTVTADRIGQVDFLPVTFVMESRFIITANSPVTGMSQLDRKRIGVLEGTSAQATLRDMLAKQGAASATLVPVKFDAMVDRLQSGDIDAMAVEDAVWAAASAQRAGAPAPKVRFIGPVWFRDPIGIMVSKNASPLVVTARQTVDTLLRSGEIATFYQRWFEQAIPTYAHPLDLPPNDSTRDAWKKPAAQPLF